MGMIKNSHLTGIDCIVVMVTTIKHASPKLTVWEKIHSQVVLFSGASQPIQMKFHESIEPFP